MGKGKRTEIGARGFSAIELMVLIAIIGILVAVAWPRLALLAPIYRLDGAARNLAIDLQKVRGRAIAENSCLQVTFDVANRSYQVLKGNTLPCSGATFSNDGAAQKVDDSGSLTMTATASPVFSPNGRMSTGTASVIALTNNLNAVRSVHVEEPFGKIYVD